MSPGPYVEQFVKTHRWLRRWWPIVALTMFVALGTLAFVVIGNLISDIQDTQRVNDKQTDVLKQTAAETATTAEANRRLNCAIARSISANPLVRYPQFETKQAFQRRVSALRLILHLSDGLDCKAILAPVTVGTTKPRSLPGARGGGANQNSPNTGSQSPGPGSGPGKPGKGGGGGGEGGGGVPPVQPPKPPNPVQQIGDAIRGAVNSACQKLGGICNGLP